MNEQLTEQQIKDLFPLEGEITEDILVRGRMNRYLVSRCTGALTLRSALDKAGIQEVWVYWGDIYGSVALRTGSNIGTIIPIGTKERVEMMDLVVPTKVTFILADQS